jgi:vacuolar-type H+-ATPase subunit E/Vma4
MTRKYALTDELTRDVDREIEEILARAQTEGEAIIAAAQAESERLRAKTAADLDRRLASERSRALAMAKVEGRNRLLETRKREIDAVLEEVRRRLLAMEKEQPERFDELMYGLFAGGRGLLPPGKIRVTAGAGRKNLQKRLAGESEVVEIVEREDLHGIIMESANGRVRCDLSLDALLFRLRADREAELAVFLFEGKDEQGR